MTLSFAQRVQRWITWRVLNGMMHVTVEGLENLPASGPYILVWNHLHISDGMLLWGGAPVPTVFLSTAKFEKKNRLVHAYLRGSGAILVRGGGRDRQAIKRMLRALNQGNPVAIAPEGRVSLSGALCSAEPGVASLVCHSGAKVIPVGIWGQHKAHERWRRFQRPRVMMRYGLPEQYPQVPPSAVNLRRITTEIMYSLARILPEQYRGAYSESHRRESAPCG